MPTIQRASLTDVVMGHLIGPVQNAVLIRICDPCTELPVVSDPRFVRQITLDFLDVVYGDRGFEFHIQPAQAQEAATALQVAYENGQDVVVHCRQGLSRSAGVCEAARQIGFDYINPCPGFNPLVEAMVSEEITSIHEEQQQP